MKTGTISFDLTDFEGKRSMENALNADHMRMKIDDLHSEVFRPFLKHDLPIFGAELTEEHHKIIEIIWMKCFEYFNEE